MRRALRAAGLSAFGAALVACQPIDSSTAEVEALRPPSSIGALQGRNARSPYEGAQVTIQGVVTGNFVSGLGGFFLQDAAGAGDRDPHTSDAVFVVWPRGKEPKVRRGDRLAVTGRVVEQGEPPLTLTAVQAESLQVMGRGGVEATPISQPPAHVREWEALEGMWIRFSMPLTVTGHENLFRFGELQVSLGDRLRSPTDVHPPGPKAQALHEENLRRSLMLDDNRGTQNPRSIWYLEPGVSAEAPLRTGSRLFGVEGILDVRHDRWRVQLTERPERIEQAPRPELPPLPEGLRLASVNLHNLFNGNGRGAGYPTPRGASTAAEYARQRAKLVSLLATLQPDIVALSEAENDAADRLPALDDLLAALNRQLGQDGDYLAVPSGVAGNDEIRVALAYRKRAAEPLGEAQSARDDAFSRHSRPPLAQTFRVLASDRSLTVVANHFKSKGGCESVPAADRGNQDIGDHQGCWNGARVDAARALDRWLKTDPIGSASPNIVLLGDFNAHTFEDPLRLLRSLGWRDPEQRNGRHTHHSFVFDGRAGTLDHALVSPGVLPAVVGTAVWQVNSDENAAFDFRGPMPEGPWASSDHDPLIVVLDPARLP